MRGTFAIPVLMVLLGLLAILAFVPKAGAHDIYMDWKTRNGASCCHDRDCAPATAWKDTQGNWTARQHGKTYRVPEHAVLPITSPDGRSHLCIIGEAVMCFVPGEVRG